MEWVEVFFSRIPGQTIHHADRTSQHLIVNISIDQQAQAEESIFIAAQRAEGPSFGARLKEKLTILRSKAQRMGHSGQSTQHSFMRPLCKEIHVSSILPFDFWQI